MLSQHGAGFRNHTAVSPGQLVIVALPYLSRDEMLMQQRSYGHLINELKVTSVS